MTCSIGASLCWSRACDETTGENAGAIRGTAAAAPRMERSYGYSTEPTNMVLKASPSKTLTTIGTEICRGCSK